MNPFRVVFALAAVLVSSVAHAAPVLEQLDYVRFYNSDDPRGWYECEQRSGAGCAGSVLVPDTNWTLHYQASGTTGYGILKAHAEVMLTGDDSQGAFPSFASVGARSGFRDVYAFHGGTGAGTATFSFAVDGTATMSGGGTARSLFQYVPVLNGIEAWDQVQAFGVADGIAQITVPFVFDQPTEFIIHFYALAQIWSWEAGSAAVADYSHTAILNQIVVRDAQQQLVNDFSITAGSGTLYTAAGVVPEPGTWLMMGSGLVLLAGMRRRQQRRLRA